MILRGSAVKIIKVYVNGEEDSLWITKKDAESLLSQLGVLLKDK